MNPETKVYYYLYEVTNLVNGKTYIGQHITDDLEDGYLGSGKALKSAIKKYGRDKFKKEILAFANGPTSLNFMERCMVPLWWTELSTNYNMMEGGHNGARMSAEARKRISLGRKGKKFGPMPEAQRLAMSQRQKGKFPPHLAKLIKENHPRIGTKHSEESKAKMAAARRGKKMPPRSEKYRRKISERQRGRKMSQETARKIGDANRGKIPTKEHRSKISQFQRNKKLTEAQKLALRKANIGRKKSQETIEKIRQAKLRPAPDLINEFTGEIVSGLKNRKKFAQDRNLSMCGLYRMIRGETKYCDGWKILEKSNIDSFSKL